MFMFKIVSLIREALNFFYKCQILNFVKKPLRSRCPVTGVTPPPLKRKVKNNIAYKHFLAILIHLFGLGLFMKLASMFKE